MPLDPRIIMQASQSQMDNPMDVVQKGLTMRELIESGGRAKRQEQRQFKQDELALITQKHKINKNKAFGLTEQNYPTLLKEMVADGVPGADRLPPMWPGDKFLLTFKKSLLDYDEQIAQMNKDRDYAQKEREIGAKKSAALPQFASDLRKERSGLPVTRATQDVSAAYNKIQKAASSPSAAGDMSLIFGYMKILDPGSTVREGEFLNAQQAAGFPTRVVNAYNKALKGERLAPDQRADFMNQAGNLYKAQMEIQNQVDSQFGAMATKAGVDPSEVILNFEATSPDGRQASNQTRKIDGVNYRKVPGGWEEIR